MENQPGVSSLWLSSAQKIEDVEVRAQVERAADRTWHRWNEIAGSYGGETIDAIAALEYAVGAAVAATRAIKIRNTEAYVFKAFLRKARKLLRRGQRIEYRDPGSLLDLNAAADTSFVQNLEHGIQVEELMNLMDERMRMLCDGLPRLLGLFELGSLFSFGEPIDVRII